GKDRDRVAVAGRDVHEVAVGAERQGLGAAETGDLFHAVALHVDLGERPGARVAAVGDQRVVGVRGDVDPAAVRAHRPGARAVQAVGGGGVQVALDEGEMAGRVVAAEDDDRPGDLAGRVEVLRVRAQGDAPRTVQVDDAVGTVGVHLDEAQSVGV